jgi:hypothetical protein
VQLPCSEHDGEKRAFAPEPPDIRQNGRHWLCVDADTRGGAMTYVHTLVGFVEHALFVMAGFILMVIGLAMGVTLVMLPVGLVVGLIGFAMFVGGLFVRNLQR